MLRVDMSIRIGHTFGRRYLQRAPDKLQLKQRDEAAWRDDVHDRTHLWLAVEDEQ